jgi:hypothetical protein
MDTKNPRTGSQGAGASKSTAADKKPSTKQRAKLQANAVMRMRLAALQWAMPKAVRHG